MLQKVKCEHDYVRMESIERVNAWIFLIFTYDKKQWLQCIKCGEKRR